MSHTNRLARETSPYLLQHAHNPVDWYPWGQEAFAAARARNKPIFLSVGYSTCYWCHVMERQCFENEAIAKEMNDRFINIKVDREERPDVDQLYMAAVQVITRQGGWPMSVFLTPDLRPFYGGTYFPPTDAHGRPGFISVLRGIEDAYRNRLADVNRSAEQIANILQQIAVPPPPAQPISIDEHFIDRLVERSIADYDSVHGGFGAAPKFPRETLLEMLPVYLTTRSPAVDPDNQISNLKSRISNSLTHTLDAMANGGIRDHLGGGFHRYSTDAEWLVPHFEIMLYDNAMLAWIYVEAYRQTEEPRYARIARGIFDFILREMTSPDGAFYTAFDAEVDAQEGLTYLWTAPEIESILGNGDAASFLRVYGVDRGPNFADPHHGNGQPDTSILHLPDGPAMENDPRIVEMRQKLYDARRKRKQPLLDTKIITSWNALMIRAFAHGGRVLQDDRYLAAAATAARFLIDHHQAADGTIYRTSRDGVVKHPGFLDDYSFLIHAMLSLHDAGADEKWRDQAHALAQVMRRKFADEAGGGFFFTDKDASDLIVRQKSGVDSPLPSGNSIAAMTMLALDEQDASRRTLSVFAAQLDQQAEAMSSMLQAAMLYVQRHGAFTVAAGSESDAERPLSPQQLAERIVGISTNWHEPTRLEVKLQILKPFHINTHESAAGMIPTELKVKGAKVDAIEYAPGEERDFAFAEQPIKVYDGETSILVTFRQPPTKRIRITLRYQPCDDNACLPEVTKEIEIGYAE